MGPRSAPSGANAMPEASDDERFLYAIYRVATKVSESLNLDSVLQYALNEILQSMRFDSGSIWVSDQHRDALVLRCYEGYSVREELPVHVPLAAPGITRDAFYSPEPLVAYNISEYALPQQERQLILHQGLISAISTRLTARDRIFGVMHVNRHTDEAFTQQEIGFVKAVAQHIGIAIDHALLYEDVVRRMREADFLNDAARRLTSTLPPNDALSTVLDLLVRQFAFVGGALFIVNEIEELKLVAAADGDDLFDVGGAVPAEVVESRQVVYKRPSGAPGLLLMGLPLRGVDEIIGVLVIAVAADEAEDAPPEADQRLASAFAEQAGLAIQNALMFARSKEIGILEERNRLAKEIHDVLAQSFSGIHLHAQTAMELLKKGQAAAGVQALSQVLTMSRVGLEEAQRSVRGLWPFILETLSLEDAIRLEMRKLKKLRRIRTRFSAEVAVELSLDRKAALYRVTQEALANVHRHSQATEVRVRLQVSQSEAMLIIADNGIGLGPREHYDLEELAGAGLRSMEERVRILGGALAIESRRGAGSKITARVPSLPRSKARAELVTESRR